MKTLSDRRCVVSSGSKRGIRVLACVGAGLLGVVTLGGCKANTGTDYHGDIDHNGQPFDGMWGESKDSSRSGDVQKSDPDNRHNP